MYPHARSQNMWHQGGVKYDRCIFFQICWRTEFLCSIRIRNVVHLVRVWRPWPSSEADRLHAFNGDCRTLWFIERNVQSDQQDFSLPLLVSFLVRRNILPQWGICGLQPNGHTHFRQQSTRSFVHGLSLPTSCVSTRFRRASQLFSGNGANSLSQLRILFSHFVPAVASILDVLLFAFDIRSAVRLEKPR